MSEFKDKTVLITGATSGIGKSTALLFAKQGAKVAVSGRRDKEGEQVVSEINELGGKGLFVRADVSDESQVKSLVSQVKEEFGAIDNLFANAGVWGDPQVLIQETKENIDPVIDINVKGVLYTLCHAVPEIIASGGGAVVTNASILGVRPMPGFSVYNASKFAVVGLTRTAALELAEQNVRVNCVCPGPIETDMLREASGGDTSQFGQSMPMRRVGEPREIAETVLWLCSEKASYVTGQVISVDGGYTAG